MQLRADTPNLVLREHQMAKSLTYNASLDGLRALSVAGVVAGHAGIAGVGGYHGVTVFFVISGYLITTLLLREIDDTNQLRVGAFYRRRFARLGPALVLVATVTLLWLLVIDLRPISYLTGLISSLTYTTDLVLPVDGVRHVSVYFEYTWSLAIEEQFYLLWPLAVLLTVGRTRSHRTLIWLIAGLISLAWLDRAVLSVTSPSHERLFYSFDTHFDSILWGCLLALLAPAWTATARRLGYLNALGWAGVAGLLVVFLRPGIVTIISVDAGGFGQVALLSLAVVAAVVLHPAGRLARLLANPALAYLGRRSYGLYLWNLLLALMFLRATGHLPARTPSGIIYLPALLLVTEASFRFVESPLRRRWAGAPRNASFATPEALDAPR